MSIFDVITAAGGPVSRADTSRVQVVKKIDGGKTKTVIFDLDEFIAKGGSINRVPKIVAGDVIFIPELPHEPNDTKATWAKQAPREAIYVMGAVGDPGRYSFVNDLGFLDVLTAAKGPNSAADLHNIRVSHRKEKGSRVTTVNLVRYFETGDERLIPKVKPGDVIFVPERGQNLFVDDKGNNVVVLGAVGKAGKVNFNHHMTILDVLAEAGGPTPVAWIEKIVIVNILEQHGKGTARLFDMVEFAKTGDIRKLPVIRPGDTIYVPDQNQNEWKNLLTTAQGFLPFATMAALFKKSN